VAEPTARTTAAESDREPKKTENERALSRVSEERDRDDEGGAGQADPSGDALAVVAEGRPCARDVRNADECCRRRGGESRHVWHCEHAPVEREDVAVDDEQRRLPERKRPQVDEHTVLDVPPPLASSRHREDTGAEVPSTERHSEERTHAPRELLRRPRRREKQGEPERDERSRGEHRHDPGWRQHVAGELVTPASPDIPSRQNSPA
jgi:hypothetical protein